MKLTGKIHTLEKPIKWFILAFMMTLSFGFYTGTLFVEHTTSFSFKGVEENYNGNEPKDVIVESWEEDGWEEDGWEETDLVQSVEVIKYKKSKREIISTIHTHVISFSLIFLAVGAILSLTSIPSGLKKFLMVEPYISIVLTFGGIWLLWLGIGWMKYVVMFSGVLLTLVYTTSLILIIWQLFKKQ